MKSTCMGRKEGQKKEEVRDEWEKGGILWERQIRIVQNILSSLLKDHARFHEDTFQNKYL